MTTSHPRHATQALDPIEDLIAGEIARFRHHVRSSRRLANTSIGGYVATIRMFLEQYPVQVAEVTEAMVADFLNSAKTTATMRPLRSSHIRCWLSSAAAGGRVDANAAPPPRDRRDIPAEMCRRLDDWARYLRREHGLERSTTDLYRGYARRITAFYQVSGEHLTDDMITDYTTQHPLASLRTSRARTAIRRWHAWCGATATTRTTDQRYTSVLLDPEGGGA